MLDGWRNQQLARNLVTRLRAFVAHATRFRGSGLPNMPMNGSVT
jgi:hypothetical protein